MSVYVDSLINHGWIFYGKPVPSCHMFADTPEELHEMAEVIGLKRSWAQDTPGRPERLHYDLISTKRKKAVANGAIEVGATEIGRRILNARKGRERQEADPDGDIRRYLKKAAKEERKRGREETQAHPG